MDTNFKLFLLFLKFLYPGYMSIDMSRFSVGIMFILLPVVLSGQSANVIATGDSLKSLFQKLYLQETDQAKKRVNRDILEYFSQVLSERESFYNPFDSLSMIGKLTAPDKSLRIFTWNIPMEGFTHEYHGLIQRPEKSKKKCKVYQLSNSIPLGNQILHSSYMHEQWPGALYYEIQSNKHGGEVFYTLLGFHFNDRFSDMKIIEIIYFTGEGEVMFGKPVFKTQDGLQHRVIFEYSGETVMTLRYKPDLRMIVFDHLSPIEPELAGHPRFYAPDFSYDGYRFRKGFWEYQPEIDVRNR